MMYDLYCILDYDGNKCNYFVANKANINDAYRLLETYERIDKECGTSTRYEIREREK